MNTIVNYICWPVVVFVVGVIVVGGISLVVGFLANAISGEDV